MAHFLTLCCCFVGLCVCIEQDEIHIILMGLWQKELDAYETSSGMKFAATNIIVGGNLSGFSKEELKQHLLDTGLAYTASTSSRNLLAFEFGSVLSLLQEKFAFTTQQSIDHLRSKGKIISLSLAAARRHKSWFAIASVGFFFLRVSATVFVSFF